jgi:hypothetical protein
VLTEACIHKYNLFGFGQTLSQSFVILSFDAKFDLNKDKMSGIAVLWKTKFLQTKEVTQHSFHSYKIFKFWKVK